MDMPNAHKWSCAISEAELKWSSGQRLLEQHCGYDLSQMQVSENAARHPPLKAKIMKTYPAWKCLDLGDAATQGQFLVLPCTNKKKECF